MSIRNLGGLIAQVSACIVKAYDKGYKAAKQDAVAISNKSEYERGLADSEKAIKRLCLSPEMGGLSYEEENIIFGRGTLADTLDKYTMAEIIEKIRKYDEQKEESAQDGLNQCWW